MTPHKASSLVVAAAVVVYAVPSARLRKLLRRVVVRVEDGECHSLALRRIFEKYHGIRVGLYSYGGCFDPEAVPPGTVVGRYCCCARFTVYSRNHPIGFLSMHPFFYNRHFGYVDRDLVSRTALCIGHDVWIGDQVLVTASVKSIGNGAVIGAGAVVTRDVPPYAVVGGNPARLIRYRFSPEGIRLAELTKWWDKAVEENVEALSMFTKPFDPDVTS